MRERVTTAPPKTTGFLVKARLRVHPYTVTNYDYVSWTTRSMYERIVDDPKTRYVEYDKKMRRRAFKPVSHDTWTGIDLSAPVWVQTGPSNDALQSACELISAFHEHPAGSDLCTTAYAYAVNTGIALDYRHYDRWLKVKPTMATRASLGVFLLELRDFKRMWDFIPNKHLLINGVKARDWGYFIGWWRKIKGSDPSITDVGSYINSQHLNYNFGWKPFVSDIQKCWRGLEKMEGRLAKFKKNADTELRRRSRDEPVYTDNSPVYTAFLENSFWRNMRILDRKSTYASAFDFSYRIPQYSEAEMRWRALADTLGLQPSIHTLYAVTPLTFVVDWFFNVGGFLKSFENDWLQPWIAFHQGCYSRKLEGSFTWNVKGSDAYGGVVLPGINVDFSQYIRKVGSPNFSATTDPLDADKIRLGASLLFSLFHK